MVVADPGSLGSALTNLLNQAGTAAQQSPNPLSDLLTEVDQVRQTTEKAQQWPSTLIDKLKQIVDPPDWWSLLAFVLVWVQKEINEPALWVGTQQPAGWSRMLTLNYSPGTLPNATPADPVLTVGLAVTDPGIKGIWINVNDTAAPPGTNPPTFTAGPLVLGFSWHGAASWRYAFGDGLKPPSGGADSWVNVLANLAPGWTGDGTPIFSVSAGTLNANITLKGATPIYSVAVGIGPLSGSLSPAAALGPLKSFFSVADINVRYRPQLVLADGSPTTFDLGG